MFYLINSQCLHCYDYANIAQLTRIMPPFVFKHIFLLELIITLFILIIILIIIVYFLGS